MGNRKEYIEKLAAKLNEWDDDIQRLEDKIEQKSAQVKNDLRAQLQELKNKKKEMSQKFEEIGDANEDIWEDFKASTELGWNALTENIKKTWEIAKK